MTLPDFLLARIAEDENVVAGAVTYGQVDAALYECDAYAYRYHIDASRVLAECEAKRRIVADFELLSDPGGLVDQLMLPSLREVLVTPLRHLAAIYAGHPDYREEWKP